MSWKKCFVFGLLLAAAMNSRATWVPSPELLECRRWVLPDDPPGTVRCNGICPEKTHCVSSFGGPCGCKPYGNNPPYPPFPRPFPPEEEVPAEQLISRP